MKILRKMREDPNASEHELEDLEVIVDLIGDPDSHPEVREAIEHYDGGGDGVQLSRECVGCGRDYLGNFNICNEFIYSLTALREAGLEI